MCDRRVLPTRSDAGAHSSSAPRCGYARSCCISQRTTIGLFLIGESIGRYRHHLSATALSTHGGVDALDDAGYEGLKDGLFSRISQLTTIGFMVSSIAGAYIADINMQWPWLCGAAGYVIAAIIGVNPMKGEKPRASGIDLAGPAADDCPTGVEGVRGGLGQPHRDDTGQAGGRDSIRRMGSVLARMADSVQPELRRGAYGSSDGFTGALGAGRMNRGRNW